MKEMKLIPQINIASRTPITTKMVWETWKVIHTYEETAALDTFSFLICDEPSIWVVRTETPFGELWEVRRGLIIIEVKYIEEIEWIVSTLKQSYWKWYEVEPERGKPKPKVTTVYISTPMSGVPKEIIWRNLKRGISNCISRGCNFITPLEVEDKLKLVHSIKEPTWGEYLLEDMKYLSQCDEILLVSIFGGTDWRKSRGCMTEIAYARGLRLPIKELLDDDRTKRLYNEEW